MSQQPDPILIKKVLDGDHGAFRFLVDRYKHMVYTLAIRMARNREDAEEIAQDSFIKAFRSLRRFKGRAKFSTWMYKIAYRTALDHLKRRQRQPYLSQFESTDREYGSNANPSTQMEAEEQTKRIIKAVESLSAEVSPLMLLHYFEDLSIREISAITGKSENAVKVNLHRGRKRLAEKLPDLLETKTYSYARGR